MMRDSSYVSYIYENTIPGARPRRVAIAFGMSWCKLHPVRLREIIGKRAQRMDDAVWYEDVLFGLAGKGRDPKQLAFALLEKDTTPPLAITPKAALDELRERAQKLKEARPTRK